MSNIQFMELNIRHKPNRNQHIPLQVLLESTSWRLNRCSSNVKGYNSVMPK